jgi:hypothetical protein
MWSGRVLAEEAAPALDEPAELDRTLRKWERERDRECLPSYHFGNIETRVEPVAPVFTELVRRSPVHPTPDLGDLFGRARSMPQVLSLPRMSMGLLSAVARPKAERPEGLSMEHTLRDLRVHLGVRRELLSRRFRSHVVVSGSEHANAEPPAYRAGTAASAKPARAAGKPRPTPGGTPATNSTNQPSAATATTATTTAADAAAQRGATPEEVPA